MPKNKTSQHVPNIFPSHPVPSIPSPGYLGIPGCQAQQPSMAFSFRRSSAAQGASDASKVTARQASRSSTWQNPNPGGGP